jgi:hypothetical protein
LSDDQMIFPHKITVTARIKNSVSLLRDSNLTAAALGHAKICDLSSSIDDETAELWRAWIPEESGTYMVKIFIWDSMCESPTALSEVAVKNIKVN